MNTRWQLAGGFLLLLVAAGLPALEQRPQAHVRPEVRPRQGAQPVATVDGLISAFQFKDLAREVAAMAPSVDRDYFAGVLANRQGRVADSVPLLEKVLPSLKISNPARAAMALRALADDYVKLHRYSDAAGTYGLLLQGFGAHLRATERRSTEDDYNTLRLLKDAPPQTISFEGPVNLPTHRNQTLDTIDATLTVNGVTESWILDTGANFTAITATFARRLGVTLSKERAQTQGITGAENDLRVAILPEMKVGGATVRNVVLIVLNDDSFNVPAGTSHYQINAVLGYPVLQALQRVTFTADGHLLAGPGSPSADDGATLYMNLLMPLLECTVTGRPVLSPSTPAPTTASSRCATTARSPTSSPASPRSPTRWAAPAACDGCWRTTCRIRSSASDRRPSPCATCRWSPNSAPTPTSCLATWGGT
jgi:predicted aspartyl protease